MSNLGMYQTIVTMAKQVGGPTRFIGLLVGGGVAIGILIDRAISLSSKSPTTRVVRSTRAETETVYVVGKESVSNDGLAFAVGDRFKVLAVDGDAVLIEKLGDANNPHVVSGKLLESISAFISN